MTHRSVIRYALIMLALIVSLSIFIPPTSLMSNALKQCKISDYIDQTTIGCGYLLVQSEPSAPIAAANGKLSIKVGAYYDNLIGPIFHHTTYNITITKINQGSKTVVLSGIFHSHSGLLNLNFLGDNSSDAEARVTNAVHDPSLLNAIVADKGGNVNFTSILPNEPGPYKVQATVLAIQNDTIQSSSEPLLSSEVYLSIGAIHSENVDYQGKPYNITITSYADYIEDFAFNAKKRTFSWNMPFDLRNISSNLNDKDIVVHEDIRVPRSLPGFNNYTSSFTATVNGVPVKGGTVVVDPYYPETFIIFHFLLTRSDLAIAIISENIQATNSTSLNFKVSPPS